MKRLLSLIIVFLLLLLTGCKQKTYPDPTSKFYVNDYADALMSYTEQEIVAYNRYMYEVYGEIQIVYATFMVSSFEEMANYDKTDLFRQWEIGKNDMGLLIILFFEPILIDDYESETLVGYAFEIGYNLEPYLPAGYLGRTTEEIFSIEDYADITDLMVMHLNYELLNKLYVDLYDETPIDYDMDLFYEEMMDAPYIPDDEPNDWLILSTLFDGSNTSIIFIILFALLGGGFGFLKIKGGGGSSGGAGIFKRRR